MILNLQWHRNCFGSAVVIVSVHLSNNTVKPEELPALIERVHETLTGLNEPAVAAGELIHCQSAVPISESVTCDYIVCLEHGEQVKDAEASSHDELQHDAGKLPYSLEPSARLSDGGAELFEAAEYAVAAAGPRNRRWPPTQVIDAESGHGVAEQETAMMPATAPVRIGDLRRTVFRHDRKLSYQMRGRMALRQGNIPGVPLADPAVPMPMAGSGLDKPPSPIATIEWQSLPRSI